MQLGDLFYLLSTGGTEEDCAVVRLISCEPFCSAVIS